MGPLLRKRKRGLGTVKKICTGAAGRVITSDLTAKSKEYVETARAPGEEEGRKRRLTSKGKAS